MKTYKLDYLDKHNNTLKEGVINASNIREARGIRDKIFAECVINDCAKIKVVKI